MNTTPNLAVCKSCGQILHSKHVHDMVICDCPNQSSVDGGPEYKKRSGKDLRLIVECVSMAEARRISHYIHATTGK